ncbi:MAG: efflux RND transporter permease subunit, partial [Candidatus Binatia bacterium]
QRRVERLLDETPEVRSYFSIVAIGRGGPGQVNDGLMFVRMQPAEVRKRHADEVLGELRRRAAEIAGANVFFFQFNPLRRGGGSKPVGFVIQHSNFDTLTRYAQKLRDAVAEMPGFTDVDTDLEINKPQLDVTIARNKARALGISVADIADTLKILLGGDAVSTYKKGNERYDVIVQLSAGDRFDAQDLSNIYVRTAGGEIVPLRHLVEVRESVGPSSVRHYARKRSVTLDANLDGIDMGHALEQLAMTAESILPQGFTTTLSGESREYDKSSRGPAFTFVLAIIAIYLVLAAQFESFVHPITIMLALPLATFGALAGLVVFGMPLSVYSYIGLIMLMGLVTKNSILLVDYINILRRRGIDTREAILLSGRTRLRPILMTAISTIFGILPIALGVGSGAEGRRPLGVAVVVGLTTSTILTLVVVPVVYSLIDELRGNLDKHRQARAAANAARAR